MTAGHAGSYWRVRRRTGWRRAIVSLLTVGGAGYPLGYVAWAGLIPYVGIERGKTLAEWLWIPFGGATIVAIWWLAALLAWRLTRSRGDPRRSGTDLRRT